MLFRSNTRKGHSTFARTRAFVRFSRFCVSSTPVLVFPSCWSCPALGARPYESLLSVPDTRRRPTPESPRIGLHPWGCTLSSHRRAVSPATYERRRPKQSSSRPRARCLLCYRHRCAPSCRSTIGCPSSSDASRGCVPSSRSWSMKGRAV